MEQYVSKNESNSPEPSSEVYIEQLLESIDGDQLSQFLSEQLRRAGFDEAMLKDRFFSPKDVSISEKLTTSRAWSNGEEINFEPKNFFPGVQDFQVYIENKISPGNYHDREMQFFEIAKFELLHIFIHEQLHHLTYTEYDYFEEEIGNDKVKKVYTRQAGIENQIQRFLVQSEYENEKEDELLHSSRTVLFRGLNEGLTELMAQELTLEYIRQYAVIDDRDVVREAPLFLTEFSAYKEERYVVEQLAAVFAEMTDVPHDIMLKSFYREYVTNGHLLPEEFENVIAEYLPTGVDKDNLEESIASLTRSMANQDFNKRDSLTRKIQRMVSFLPDEKIQHCEKILDEIDEKYYPTKKS